MRCRVSSSWACSSRRWDQSAGIAQAVEIASHRLAAAAPCLARVQAKRAGTAGDAKLRRASGGGSSCLR